MATSLYRLHFPNQRPYRTDRDSLFGKPGLDFALENFATALTGKLLTLKKPSLQKPELISSYKGSIDEILFMLPENVFTYSDDVTYRALLRKIPVGTKFIVAAHESVMDAVTDLFHHTGHSKNALLIQIPSHISFTDWAEDAFLGVRDAADSKSRFLLKPFYFWRQADSMIGEYVEDGSDVRAIPTPLLFQGGNCLIGDRFWLMGEDYFADTLELLSREGSPVALPDNKEIVDEDVVALFKQHVDGSRKLIRVKTDLQPLPSSQKQVAVLENGKFYLDYPYRGIGRQQPVFHIDMFVTLVGRPTFTAPFTIMVGSPRLAAEIAGLPLAPYSLQGVFDDVAENLSTQGFDVIRNPLPVVFALGDSYTLKQLRSQRLSDDLIADFIALGANDNSVVFPRDWYHASTNNCLVEESSTKGNHVYMPTFGNHDYPELTKVDDYMKDLWTKQGFTMHQLGDFHSFARRLGVVHCIKKYLARGD